MPRIKLTLEYDGTGYVGWQAQPNGPSVQEALQRALERLVGHPVALAAAGRTDAGVHALGQVACFDTVRELPLKAYWRGLNGLLPPDIAVVHAGEVAAAFDPRRWSHGKHYRYLVSNRPSRSPLRRTRHWEVFQPLALEPMQRAARALVGRHDYSAFRASSCQAAHAVREVRVLRVEGRAGDALCFDVEGTAFVKHMVRNLVGTLMEVGRGRRPEGWVAEVLAARERTRAGPTAPAHGLTLVEVRYGDGDGPPPRGAGGPDPGDEED